MYQREDGMNANRGLHIETLVDQILEPTLPLVAVSLSLLNGKKVRRAMEKLINPELARSAL